MVLIVTRVVRLAVGPVRPVGATTRVYGATTQDGIVGVMLFGIRVVGAVDRDFPAVLPGNRCTDAAPVIVIVQRRVGRLIRPVAGAVVATVCGDRSTDGSAQGEQDHNADAGAEIHECLPVCP